MTKVVYNYDAEGVYIGDMVLDESDLSPLEPDLYLIPASCTEVPPPEAKEGTRQVFKEGAWSLEDIPEVPVEVIRVQKIHAVSNLGESLIWDGVKVEGHWFSSDYRSRNQHQTLLAIANHDDISIEWQTLKEETVTMTPKLSCKILTACLDLEQKTMKVLRGHLTALTETLDPKAYDIEVGWPETFSTQARIEN